MINQVILMGRLTADPETRFMQASNNSVTRFNLAVERDYKAANEEKPKTDFINCTAWNKTGEFVEKYFKKGNMIAVTGCVETGSYTNNDGNKVYTTEIKVNKVSFTGEKTGDSNTTAQRSNDPTADGFMIIPEGIDEDLPFAQPTR